MKILKKFNLVGYVSSTQQNQTKKKKKGILYKRDFYVFCIHNIITYCYFIIYKTVLMLYI